MKKLLAVASATLMLTSVAGVAVAHHQDGHDQNYRGLCTAMFSGSENGQEKKQENGQAFIVFRETAKADGADQNDDGEVDNQEMRDWCVERTGGAGNPGQGNGRR